MAISYVMIGTSDLERALGFWDVVFSAMGWTRAHDYPGMTRGYSDGGVTAWVARPYEGEAATPANGSMVGFGVASRDKVDAVHAAVLAAGGTCAGPPGPRPLYGPDFYGAYFRDLDGNKYSVVLAG